MSEPKKTTPKAVKAIADVAHPGKSAPSDTSKSIITQRPIMKDPMVVEDNADKPEDAAKKPLSKPGQTKIEPPGTLLTDNKDEKADKAPEADEPPKKEKKSEPAGTLVPKETDEKPDEPKSDSETETETEDEPGSKPDKTEEPDSDAPDEEGKADDKDKKTKQPEEDAEAAAQAEQDAKLQKVIDSKKYFLPINAVEQRRSKHFVVLGVFLALLLAVAWADIAIDAGLIKIGSIKPVTHFFSN